MYNNRQNVALQKPENVLKRANDLIKTAGPNPTREKIIALDQLHNVLSQAAKRKGTVWTKVHEQVMKRHLELCVDLKDHRLAKDGLHQYRNLCQNVDPNSLEIVIVHLLDLSELHTAAARQRADNVYTAMAAQICDLDQEETPESIMLASMTDEGAKDRTDREVVVPWLKFLWETYRAIIELLHKNVKLEKVYHRTCEKAFKFCLEYKRTQEFRRLCMMLRDHLSNLQKIAGVPVKLGRISWDWTAEAIELHLQTRFSQLEIATSLELWNEGFRIIEDIHTIMLLGKKSTKPKLMAIYYEKLTRIFWVSENYLFHAYAWLRYYSLSCDCRKDMKPEEKSILASCALLAAMIVPSSKDLNADNHSLLEYDDEVATEKNKQIATVLDFQANPTRKALLNDLVSKGIVSEAIPALANLYEHMESKFQPLKLAQSLVPIISAIKEIPQLSPYATPLQHIAVVRVVQQLSRVYSTVRMEFLKNLLAPLSDVSYNTVEKLMIDAVARKQLQLKIDHNSKCIKFGAPVTVTSVVDSQASQLGISLNKVVSTINRLSLGDKKGSAVADREKFFKIVATSETEDHNLTVSRQTLIETRKENLEHIHATREQIEEAKKIEQMNHQIEQEKVRLQYEAALRNKEQNRKIQERQDILKLQVELQKCGVIKDESSLLEMDVASRNALLADARMEAAKAKEEEGRRFNEQAKRLDHVTRALRIEAAEKLQDVFREQHAVAFEEMKRLSHMQGLRGTFEESILANQRLLYEQQIAKMKVNSVKEYRDRKIAKARALLAAERNEVIRKAEEAEREKHAKEERDRQEREQHENIRRRREEEEASERRREQDEDNFRRERHEGGSRMREAPPQREVDTEESWARRRVMPPAAVIPVAAARQGPGPAEEVSTWRGASAPLPASSSATKEELSKKSEEVSKWRGSGKLEDKAPVDEVLSAKWKVRSDIPTPASGVDDKWRSKGGGSSAPAAGAEGSVRKRPASVGNPTAAAPPARNLEDWGRKASSTTPNREEGAWRK